MTNTLIVGHENCFAKWSCPFWFISWCNRQALAWESLQNLSSTLEIYQSGRLSKLGQGPQWLRFLSSAIEGIGRTAEDGWELSIQKQALILKSLSQVQQPRQIPKICVARQNSQLTLCAEDCGNIRRFTCPMRLLVLNSQGTAAPHGKTGWCMLFICNGKGSRSQQVGLDNYENATLSEALPITISSDETDGFGTCPTCSFHGLQTKCSWSQDHNVLHSHKIVLALLCIYVKLAFHLCCLAQCKTLVCRGLFTVWISGSTSVPCQQQSGPLNSLEHLHPCRHTLSCL